MSVSIVFGGQYGSEGKGKVAYLWAKKMSARIAVRVGGSNSGHTVYHKKRKYVFQMLPTACLRQGVVSVLPAGSYLDITLLQKEIEDARIKENFLRIDPNAVIVQNCHKEKEAALHMKEAIGSTLSGTGVAFAARVLRGKDQPVLLARDVPALKPYLCDTKHFLRECLNKNEHVVIEGTQGYGLSNYHAKAYPYATGRDTSAAGFLSETGLSPFDVEYVLMVLRAFPIRVAGNSGPLPQEIDWTVVSQEAGAKDPIEEKTTVTRQVRRVARFDSMIVKEAIQANRPNRIILNHLDYFDATQKGASSLSEHQKNLLKNFETDIGQRIDYAGNDESDWIALME